MYLRCLGDDWHVILNLLQLTLIMLNMFWVFFQLIVSDFFLGKQLSENGFVTIPLRDEFLENARLFIFETYCRIHQCIDIGMLSQKLNMNYDDAERWIVNLIRNARLDAKIDSKMGTVVMGTQHPNM